MFAIFKNTRLIKIVSFLQVVFNKIGMVSIVFAALILFKIPIPIYMEDGKVNDRKFIQKK